nr:hypothetical protein [uncultured Campylobacter sp.]
MLTWLNLKRQNFLRINFKFHGVKIRSQSSCGRSGEFKILLRQDGILRAKIKR